MAAQVKTVNGLAVGSLKSVNGLAKASVKTIDGLTLALAYSEEVLADSPLLYWRLDESSGATAADSSGNSRPGTYTTVGTGSITYSVTGAITTDSSSTAVTANSTNSSNYAYVQRAASTVWDTSSFTIEAWVLPSSSATSNRTIAAVADGGAIRWIFRIKADLSELQFVDNATVETRTVAISNSAWTHVVYTWDGTNSRYYANGSQVGSNGTLGPGAATNKPFTITWPGRASVEFLMGSIDEVALYGTALSSARILAHYNAAF